MLAARPPGCALAVVVVQFGRVSRPGLARRTVGLPASQPRSGPSLLRLETQKLPQLALLQLVTPSHRPFPCGVFMAVCGCRRMQSQESMFFSRLHHCEESALGTLGLLGCSC